MRFSRSAQEAPWIIAPMTWLSAVSGLTGSPQSFTETILMTRTSPVSVSTSTSANCVPARSPRKVSYCFFRFAVQSIVSPDIFAAACLKVTDFVGSFATKIFPFAASSSSARDAEERRGQGEELRPRLVRREADHRGHRVDGHAAPEPGPSGNWVSPMRMVTAAVSMPSSSAATTAIAVREPVPMSW